MADTLMINVSENFSLEDLGQELLSRYTAKGFQVNVANRPNELTVQFDKGCGGINNILGMGKGITANCTLQGNTLIVNYTNAEWTGKIIGLAIGWVLCMIPFITALIGCIGQLSLSKEINTDITMIANSSN